MHEGKEIGLAGADLHLMAFFSRESGDSLLAIWATGDLSGGKATGEGEKPFG
jgi:hypothetical protein